MQKGRVQRGRVQNRAVSNSRYEVRAQQELDSKDTYCEAT